MIIKKTFYRLLILLLLLVTTLACSSSPSESPQVVESDTPASESATEEPAANETATEESTSNETPTEESTSNETPTEESTSNETPTEESTSNETPTEESTSNETPTEESTSNETPTEEPAASECSHDAQFVADVTIPDDTVIAPGESFTKTWRLKNSGTCTWTTEYEFVFIAGEQMAAPQSVNLNQPLSPEAEIEMSVDFTAPTEPGTYVSLWQLRTPDGTLFGIEYYVQIVVTDDVPAATEEPANETPTEESAGSECTHEAQFVADVTIPDNTVMAPGQSFTKTWRLQNSGTCTWTTLHKFDFITGQQMAAPQSVKLPENVAPGALTDLSVDFIAPTEPGIYVSLWQLRTPDGTLFGIEYYVQIVVADSNEVPTATQEPAANETPIPEPAANETPIPEPAANETPIPEPASNETPIPEPTDSVNEEQLGTATPDSITPSETAEPETNP